MMKIYLASSWRNTAMHLTAGELIAITGAMVTVGLLIFLLGYQAGRYRLQDPERAPPAADGAVPVTSFDAVAADRTVKDVTLVIETLCFAIVNGRTAELKPACRASLAAAARAK